MPRPHRRPYTRRPRRPRPNFYYGNPFWNRSYVVVSNNSESEEEKAREQMQMYILISILALLLLLYVRK